MDRFFLSIESHSTRRRFLAMAVMLGTLSGLAAPLFAQNSVHYRIVPIAAPEGTSSMSALDLNTSNEVTGGAIINTQVHPYLYRDGQSSILDQVEGTNTVGAAVNDQGHVTGWMYEWGVIWPQAFLWDGQTNHWLVDPNDSYTYAQGLNERDQVVGFYYPPGGHPNGNAFVVNDGVYHNLGPGQATDISESGVIVGQINRASGETAVWSPDGRGSWTRTVLDGLLATAINDSGTMFCGAGPSPFYFHTPVLWTKESGQWVRTDIGDWDPSMVDALSNDVNDRGQVVGKYASFTENDRGWIYQHGEVQWLTDLLAPAFAGWEVMSAARINESGVILADARPEGGRLAQPVLLIPDSLTILGPRGQGAGSTNELIATSASPGSRIYFAVGFATGSREVPGCPGVNVGLSAPRVIGSAIANTDLEARIPVRVPGAAAGRSVYLQAIDPSHCEVSRVLRYTFR